MTQTDTVLVNVSVEEIQGNLMYCLLTDVILIESECVQVYGVSVSFEQDGRIEMEKIHNVTTAKDEMLELIHTLKEGLVFPIGLKDIVEDFIA